MNETKKILMEAAEKAIDFYLKSAEEQGVLIEVTDENIPMHIRAASWHFNDRWDDYKKVHTEHDA